MTKLDAVREILYRNGLRPSGALQTGTQSDMGIAEDMLDQEELAVQARGWHYNTIIDYELSPVLYAITNAAWTDATKTLTQTGSFEDATVGQTITITSGATAGNCTVATKVSDNAVTLEEDISSGGDIASGIVGVAANNKIALPASTIRVDTDRESARFDFTQQGGRVYDRIENTDMFTVGYKFTLIDRKDWGCIQMEVRRWVCLRAAIRFSEHRMTDQYASIMRAEADAKRRAFRLNSVLTNANFFRTSQAARSRGFRSRLGASGPGNTEIFRFE